MSARDRVKWANEVVKTLGPKTAFPLIMETLQHDEWVANNRHTEGLAHRVTDIPVTPEEDEFLTELTSRQATGGTLHAAKRETQAERLDREAKEALGRPAPLFNGRFAWGEEYGTPITSDPNYSIPSPRRSQSLDDWTTPEKSVDNALDMEPAPKGPTGFLPSAGGSISKEVDESLDVPTRPLPRLGHARMTDAEKTEALRGVKREPSMSHLKQREGDQELPVKNSSTPIQHLVLKDILERMDVGYKRYGTYLQAHNGRRTLQDAYEEALDLAIYLRQLMEETPGAAV